MNEGELTPQQNSAMQPIKTGIPIPESHPLHMLDNQADPETKPKIILQKPIRTYESDMAELMALRNTSSSTIAIAEQQRKIAKEAIAKKNIPTTKTPIIQPTTPPVEKIIVPKNVAPTITPIKKPEEQEIVEERRLSGNFGRKLFMFLLSLIFIACGLGGGYYLYTKSPLATTVPTPATPKKIPSIVTPDVQKTLAVGNLKNELLAQKIQSQMAGSNTDPQKITEFVITGSQASSTTRINALGIIESLGYSSPDMFNRSLVDSWMLGVYGTDNSKEHFIILKTDFFQNAFAGILRWEAAMPEELATLLNYRDKIKAQNAMGSSTVATYFSVKGKFEDKIILNRDVREFVTEGGTTLLLYSFIDKDTIIITTSETALRGIVEKLEKQTYLR
jgi:hypothetical protein